MSTQQKADKFVREALQDPLILSMVQIMEPDALQGYLSQDMTNQMFWELLDACRHALLLKMSTQGARQTIKRIHVDKHIVAANRKHGRNDPAITVQTSKGSQKCYAVDIQGPSEVIQSETPLKCGARVWIETKAEVEIFSKDAPKRSQQKGKTGRFKRAAL